MIRLVSPITGWVSSVAIHAAAVTWLLQAAHSEPVRPPLANVTLSVVSPPRATRPLPVDPAKLPAADKAPAQNSAPKPAREPVSKPARTVSGPVDLSGVTLTGGDGAGWASMTGNGLAMAEPIRPTVAAAAASTVAPSNETTKLIRPLPPPEVVPARDLATRPMPPVLNASLLANYPPLAKRQGLAGNAKLLVRIDSDGVVRRCTVQSASSAEFGTACRQTLLGSRWSTPRDRLGNAVVTQVYYTCDFRVSGS